MQQLFIVGIGGFLGAICRYALGRFIHIFYSHSFPLSTLLVNLMGSLAVGFLFESLKSHPLLPFFTLFLAIGFMGSFTTFSAFSYETIQLIRHREISLACLNIFLNFLLSFLGVILGIYFGEKIS